MKNWVSLLGKEKSIQIGYDSESGKILISFCLDLLRVVAAYRSLIDHKNEYFVADNFNRFYLS
jgi:hypothetical protein